MQCGVTATENYSRRLLGRRPPAASPSGRRVPSPDEPCRARGGRGRHRDERLPSAGRHLRRSVLLDGRHRALACERAGVPVPRETVRAVAPPGRAGRDQPESPATPHGREPAGAGRGEAGEPGRGAAAGCRHRPNRPQRRSRRPTPGKGRLVRPNGETAPIGAVLRTVRPEGCGRVMKVKVSRRFDAAGGGHQDRSGLGAGLERGHVTIAADACRVRDEPAEVQRRVVETCRGRPSADPGWGRQADQAGGDAEHAIAEATNTPAILVWDEVQTRSWRSARSISATVAALKPLPVSTSTRTTRASSVARTRRRIAEDSWSSDRG